MRSILRLISIIGHPIFMPSIGFILIKSCNLNLVDFLILNILVVVLPLIIVIYLLKIPIKKINLKDVKDRKLPIMIELIGLLIAWLYFYSLEDNLTLLNALAGIIISLIINLLLVLKNVKSSLHLTGIMGVVAIQLNLNGVSLFLNIILISGLLIAISRYYLKAHTIKEIFIGTIVGFTPMYLII